MTENPTPSEQPAAEPVQVLPVSAEELLNEIERLKGLLRKAAEYNAAAHAARDEARGKAASAIRDAKKRAEARYKGRAEKNRRHQEAQLEAMRGEVAAATQLAEETATELESLRELTEREKPMLCIIEMHAKLSKPVKGCVCMGCRLVTSRLELQEQIKAIKDGKRAEAKAHGKPSKKKKGGKRGG
jgi:hypothetical protein